MLRKYITFTSTIFLLLFFCGNVFSKENAISIGGKNGWSKFSYEKGITLGIGRFGYTCVELATDERRVTRDTDLLLPFEDNALQDKSENYNVVSSSLLYTENAKMGKRAALARGMDGGMRLHGKSGTLFGTEGRAGSFTIEFWLFPALCENGEIVFSWRSSKKIGSSPVLQLITASFSSNRMQWRFSNVFFAIDFSTTDIVLTSHNTVLPEQWAHHVLTYDEASGLLEYKIDGRVEALKFVTKNGQEASEVLDAEIGAGGDIEIAPFFTGCIDDFRILRSATSYDKKYYTYNVSGGRFESETLMTTGTGSIMTSISTVVQQPAQTDVQFYVRAGENMFDWTSDYPVWKPVKNGEKIAGIQGRYFQVAADLYTDGLGLSTPKITEIILHYQENRPPVPPYAIFATAYEGAVELNWSQSADGRACGYYVYYGETPGEYLGSVAVEGYSPIDVKKNVSTRISGLENGRIYYFAVAAYGDESGDIVGALSREVYARPTRGLYNER